VAINAVRFDVRDYGAKGGGVIDDYIAFRKALTKALSVNGELFIPPGNYRISNRLFVNAPVKITGVGDSSQIFIDNDPASAIYLSNASNVTIRDLKIKSLATVRNSSQECIYIIDSTNVIVDNVSCDGSAATFALVRRSHECVITNCNINNTLADGIHITDGSTGVIVSNNILINTGDDSIAVVSYVGDGAYCEDVTITGNQITNSKSRGITHVGGKRVIITNNNINGTASSGILVLRDGFYNTYAPYDTIVGNNILSNVGAVTPAGANRIGIEITTDATNVTVIGNNIIGGAFRGITATATVVNLKVLFNTVTESGETAYQFTGVDGMGLSGNTSHLAYKYGIILDGITNSDVSNNRIYNSNTSATAGADNIYLVGCSDTVLANNVSIDNRSTILAERGMEVNNCSGLVFSGNIIEVSTQTAPFFSGTNANHKRIGFFTVTSVPSMTYYAAGQQTFNLGDGLTYNFDGSVWTAIAVSGGGGGSTTTAEKLSTLPAANAGNSGRLVVLLGGTNVPDRTYICKKMGDNAYHWKQIDSK
jgi:parallel beta-helix repeat protein